MAPQINKSLKTKKTDDVSKWLIISLIGTFLMGDLWNYKGRHRDRISECHWCYFKYNYVKFKVKITRSVKNRTPVENLMRQIDYVVYKLIGCQILQ